MDISARCDSIAAAAATIIAVAGCVGWPNRAKELDREVMQQSIAAMLAAKRSIARDLTEIEIAVAGDESDREA